MNLQDRVAELDGLSVEDFNARVDAIESEHAGAVADYRAGTSTRSTITWTVARTEAARASA